MEEKILVIYIGVAGIRGVDIEDYVNKISEKISPSTFKGEVIIIPVQTIDTRIECINPKYITDESLIEEHTNMLNKLKKELNYQTEQLNEKN